MTTPNPPPSTPEPLAHRVTLMPGAYVAPGVEVEENVIIGHNAVILAPAAGSAERTIIRMGSEIGANATILAGVTIGIKAKVSPGSVVSRSVPPLAIVEGNPARITGYVETAERETIADLRQDPLGRLTHPSRVKGVTLHRLRMVSDLRGNLSIGEFQRDIPFTPSRYFIVFDVPTAETRGEHAHLHCQQFLVAIRGSIRIVADDGENREEFILDSHHLGLYLPPLVWGIQYRYSADAMLLVFASDYYNPDDYIRSYDDFLKRVRPEGERTQVREERKGRQ